MEIVKPGREMVNVCYGTCRRCACEVRCSLSEAKTRTVTDTFPYCDDVIEREALVYDCPNPGCGETIWLYRSDFD